MNKMQCPGPSSTITWGSFNSIINRCEYSIIAGGTSKYNGCCCCCCRCWPVVETHIRLKIKSRLLEQQFVPIQRIKSWETSHPLEVATTTRLKVNILASHVEGITRQREKDQLYLVITGSIITTMHCILISQYNQERFRSILHQLLHWMLLQIGFFSLSRQLLLRSHKTKLGTSRRCWGIIKHTIFSIANKEKKTKVILIKIMTIMANRVIKQQYF